ncbi:MAG: DUF2225 domain-containing protein [Lachnospiraceae bacterium]|nr:DUF2225 domain-containing protein [Lachnospiraceae bacterium]
MGILSGMANLGLGNLANADIYASAEKDKATEADDKVAVVLEKDLIYDKSVECPVCGAKFSTKIMKSGKAKLLHADQDLRPVYEGIDATKYDVLMCTSCGNTGLTRFFPMMTSVQCKLIKENISKGVRIPTFSGETYSYDDAMIQYQLALACAVVKRAKNSEKAYICLKSAWLLRGYAEYLEQGGEFEGNLAAKLKELKANEEEYLLNAYNGFLEARQGESFPMCGMDEITIDFLVAVLATRFKKFDVAGKLVASILTSPSANARTKEKARELKEEILAGLKKK